MSENTDIEIAHEAALTVNELVNKKFPQKVKRGQKEGREGRDEYVDSQTTDALMRQAEKTVQKEKELFVDKMTGLGSERKYENDSINALTRVITVSPDQSTIEVREGLRNLHIFRLDIGFMAYANDLSGGHATGDRYKLAIADIVGGRIEEVRKLATSLGIKFEGYVTTKGDELAVIAFGTKEQALALETKIQQEAARLEIGPEARLPASTSVGIVSADEFFDKYGDFERENRLPIGGFHKRYFQFLNEIADFRSVSNKLATRLELLCRLYKQSYKGEITSREYENLRPYVTKGVVGITDDQLNFLIESNNLHESIRVVVNNIMQQRYQTGLERTTDHLRKFTYQVILEIVR